MEKKKINIKVAAKTIVTLCILCLLFAANLFWKFSTSASFSDMSGGRQFNVIASVIGIVVLAPTIVGLIALIHKDRNDNTEK
jgi:uncharacterized membrane protein